MSETAKNLYTPVQLTGVYGATDHELCVLRTFGERDHVADLVFSQEGAPQTHQSAVKISRNTGIRQSFGCIIHDLFTATHPPKLK